MTLRFSDNRIIKGPLAYGTTEDSPIGHLTVGTHRIYSCTKSRLMPQIPGQGR